MSCFYFVYICIFDCWTIFSTSRYSKLRSLIFYFVYVNEYCYTHSLHFSFQIRCVSALLPLLLLCTMMDYSKLVIVVGGCYLVYPLDMFLIKPSYLLHVFLLILNFIWCIILMRIFVDVWDAGYLERICVSWLYKLYFSKGSCSPFFK